MSICHNNKLLEEYNSQFFDILSEDEKIIMPKYSFYAGADAVSETYIVEVIHSGDIHPCVTGTLIYCCCDFILMGFLLGSLCGSLSNEIGGFWDNIYHFLMRYVPSVWNCLQYGVNGCEGNQTWPADIGEPILYSVFESCCYEGCCLNCCPGTCS